MKRLMALSLGVQRAQLEQRIGLVCPRPCLLRPLFLDDINFPSHTGDGERIPSLDSHGSNDKLQKMNGLETVRSKL